MSEGGQFNGRISITKTQLQDGVGAELFSLCQSITADGKLSRSEVIALRSWLRENRDAPLPGIAFLSETLNRIIADGHVTREEQRELLEAIEKVLPLDARMKAKSARKAVEAKRKADEKTAKEELKRQEKVVETKRRADEKMVKEELRRREREERERRLPEDEFDFMIAGVQFEGRYRIIARNVNVGDRVRIAQEPDNPKDEYAVAVTLIDGRHIGYVPRTDSEDVAACIDDHWCYVATVKKILTGRSFPVPVVDLQFYRRDQLDDIKDLAPDPCFGANPRTSTTQGGGPRKPWWRFW